MSAIKKTRKKRRTYTVALRAVPSKSGTLSMSHRFGTSTRRRRLSSPNSSGGWKGEAYHTEYVGQSLQEHNRINAVREDVTCAWQKKSSLRGATILVCWTKELNSWQSAGTGTSTCYHLLMIRCCNIFLAHALDEAPSNRWSCLVWHFSRWFFSLPLWTFFSGPEQVLVNNAMPIFFCTNIFQLIIDLRIHHNDETDGPL